VRTALRIAGWIDSAPPDSVASKLTAVISLTATADIVYSLLAAPSGCGAQE
jgi:hypothetical protein